MRNKTDSRGRNVGRAALALGLTLTMSAQAATAAPPAQAASAVTVDGGTVLGGRVTGADGDIGVTFGFEQSTIGGRTTSSDHSIYNLPMYKATGNLTDFWNNYVDQLLAAGVDFVAPVLRGYAPGRPIPDGGGDPRELSELVAAINRRGAADRLKVAAFDDTPASMTDKKNFLAHHTGGYTPRFDMGDVDGSGEGGYRYIWDNNLRAFFTAVPDNLRYKIDGRPVIYEWSINSFAFSNQGGGNAARMLRYVRERANTEFGVNPYLNLDTSWFKMDPGTRAEADAANGWFTMPSGNGMTLTTFDATANDDEVVYTGGWTYSTNRPYGNYRDDLHYTNAVGAAAEYPFVGTGIQYYAETQGNAGPVDVYLDDVRQTSVDLRTPSRLAQQLVYKVTGLVNGPHKIKIVNTSTGAASVDMFRSIDGRSGIYGRAYGVTVPAFNLVSPTVNRVVDPAHGGTLDDNLDATVNAGSTATLVEGFTDWAENASLWRAAAGTYAARQYDYPNQRLNILRRYSKKPFPADLRIQAEGADSYFDTTTGNQWAQFRDGDLDVERSGDDDGSWNVGAIAEGEWLQWQDVPLQGTVTLKVRAAAPHDGSKLRFVVDGVAGPTITLPNTGDWQTYRTVEAGTFVLPAGTYHTVRLEMVGGTFNLNYWTN